MLPKSQEIWRRARKKRSLLRPVCQAGDNRNGVRNIFEYKEREISMNLNIGRQLRDKNVNIYLDADGLSQSLWS
jgi:hypothetical protein